MFLTDLVCGLFVGLILTLVFTGGLPRQGRWANFIFFFGIVFLAAWAGGVWITPVGTSFWGVYWLSFVLVGLIVALVLAQGLPRRPPRSRQEAIKQALEMIDEQREAEKAFGLFFWLLIGVLLFVIIMHYW
jgi:hypothetical protein